MTNTRISDLINSQSPQFVRGSHQNFIQFLEFYYKFMEEGSPILSQGGVVDRTKNLLNYIDVDNTHPEISQIFYKEFLKFIPEETLADKDLLLKHILDFYSSKGTERGLRFLLRILFGKEVQEIYYPKRDILRASDGKWFIKRSLRLEWIKINDVLTTNPLDAYRFIGKEVIGTVSQASSIVEDVNTFFESGTQVTELFISSIKGEFSAGEEIETTYVEEGITYTLTAKVFLGILLNIRVTNPGSGYQVGNPISIESGLGSGATAVVSKVNSGNVRGISIASAGAGFTLDDPIVFSGGGGSGASGTILAVDTSEAIHPNTYTLFSSIIDLEANTEIGNTVYSNLNFGNANTELANSLGTILISNIGPLVFIQLNSSGTEYSGIPTADVFANTELRSMGSLGRMEIIQSGSDYQVGDVIEFSGSGAGANAVVTAINGSGGITQVRWTANSGWPMGGFGYSQTDLPTTNVRTSSGTNANIAVTAILGDGEVITVETNDIGGIEEIQINSRGSGYIEPPYINLQAYGSGTAQAIAEIMSSGVYSYPGYYLNDDGHVSAFNFLQDRDYYQNYSYVIRIEESIENYFRPLYNLAHPSGMKMFGEYMLAGNNETISINTIDEPAIIWYEANYSYDNVERIIEVLRPGFYTNAYGYVLLDIQTGNLESGLYNVSNTDDNIIVLNDKYLQPNTSGITLLGIPGGLEQPNTTTVILDENHQIILDQNDLFILDNN